MGTVARILCGSAYMELMKRRYAGKLDSDADEFIDFAVDGANRMQTLINDLLAYSRGGTRGKPLTPTDCTFVLEQLLMNLEVAIDASGAMVTHDPLPTVMADGSQLAQVFQNLIGNAIKYNGEEPPRIHIAVEQRGGEWVFSVADNGIGIDPESFDRIFERFQRLHGRDEYPGYRDRSCGMQEACGAARRQDVGGIRVRAGFDVLFHDSRKSVR